MMQPWFKEAKLGIFIHYGLYSVKGVPESWSFFNGQIAYDDYMAQCAGFTAANYDPAAWAGPTCSGSTATGVGPKSNGA